jgi:hypothetical protein
MICSRRTFTSDRGSQPPKAVRPRPTAVRGTASRIGLLLSASWLWLAPAPMAVQTRNVLVLYSNTRLLPANVEAEHGLPETIAGSSERRVEIYTEFLDAPHFGGESYADTVATYLSEKYSSQPPDAIVVGAEEALVFLLRHRAQLFPRAPLVHMGVARSFLRSIPPLPSDVVGVPIEYDFSGTIDQALHWHPKARRLVLVTGATAQDREWEARLHRWRGLQIAQRGPRRGRSRGQRAPALRRLDERPPGLDPLLLVGGDGDLA